MLRIVARLSLRARRIAERSPFTSVMPPLSIATSVPVPIVKFRICAGEGSQILHKSGVAHGHPLTVNQTHNSFSGDADEFAWLRERQTLFCRSLNDCAGQRMLAGSLDTGGQAKSFAIVVT